MTIEEYERMIAEYQNQITVIKQKIDKLRSVNRYETAEERRFNERRIESLYGMKLNVQRDLKQLIKYVDARKEREQK